MVHSRAIIDIECMIDAWTAIDFVVLIVHDLDLLVQFSVRHLPLAGRSFAPSVITTGRHTQHSAHNGNWVLFPVGLDVLESHRLGCEKMATAFFSMSLSWRRTLFSRSS